MDVARLNIRVDAQTGEAERALDSTSEKLNNFARNTGRQGALLSAGITTPLLLAGRAAFDMTAEFERTMSVLQHTIQAPATAMDQLAAQAIQLGADTSFSAGEAAGAMLELGKAGLDTQQIMGAIPGVLSLAAAGGVSLGAAAELAAASLNTFGLEAEQVSYVADLMANAANASSANISDLMAGMAQAGFAFDMAGQQIDDLAASLAILTNVGLSGSDAGTALKNAFMRMMNPTKEAAAVMQELGVSFYDAQGNMKELPAIIGMLNTAFEGMTSEQRDAALSTMFMSDGMKALVPLLEVGQAGFEGYLETVNRAGAASESANAYMSGLAGAAETLSGSIESAAIALSSRFADGAAVVILNVANLVDAFTNLPAPIQNAALAFAAVFAATGPVLLAISGISAALAFLLSPLGLVVTAVAALAAAFAADFMGIRTVVTAAVGPIQTALATIGASISEWVGVLSGITLSDLTGQLDAFVASLGPDATAAVSAFATGLQTAFDSMLATLQTFWTYASGVLAPGVARLREAFAGAVSGVSALGPSFGELGTALGELGTALQGLLAALQPVAAFLGVVLGGAVVIVASLLTNTLAAAFNALPSVVSTVIAQMTASIQLLTAVVSGVVTTVKQLLEGDFAGAWETVKTTAGEAATFIGGTFERLISVLGVLGAGIGSAFVGTLSDLGVDVTGLITEAEAKVQQFMTWLEGLSVGAMFEGVSGAFSSAVDAITGWAWPDVPDLLASFSWPDLPKITWPNWPTFSWPAFPTFSWPTLPTLSWPAMPDWLPIRIDMPDWVDRLLSWRPSLPGWLGGGGGGGDATPAVDSSGLAEAAAQLNSFSFTWPAYPEFTWPALPAWTWPEIARPSWVWTPVPAPSWLSRLVVPRPSWLGELLSWSPVVQVRAASGGGGGGGTSGAPSGGAAGGGGGGSNLVAMGFDGPQFATAATGPQIIINATVTSQQDIEVLANRVADKIRRARR